LLALVTGSLAVVGRDDFAVPFGELQIQPPSRFVAMPLTIASSAIR
jgi:hypothetical protein